MIKNRNSNSQSEQKNNSARLFNGSPNKNDFSQRKSYYQTHDENVTSQLKSDEMAAVERTASMPTRSSIFDNLFSGKHDASETPESIMEQYGFRQIETAIVAFVGNLQLKLNRLLPNLPVFVLQTGDDTFLFRKKFEKVDVTEINMTTPRFEIKFDSLTIARDQNTMQYNEFVYNYKGITYQCVGRRVAVNLAVNTFFVSPNFIKALQNFEILLSLFSRTNIFTYEWAGLTFEAGYSSLSNSEDYPSMETGSQTKNMVLNNSLELQLQLLVPRTETIKRWDDGMGGEPLIPKFEIEIKDEFGDTTDKSEVDVGNSELPNPDDNDGGLPGLEIENNGIKADNRFPKYPAGKAPVNYVPSNQKTYETPSGKFGEGVMKDGSNDYHALNPVQKNQKENDSLLIGIEGEAKQNGEEPKYPIPDSMPKDYNASQQDLYDVDAKENN